jgi:pimeloyl-ACP methyl ester carboxylesterase
VRLISFDRPGYGESERKAGRQVADVSADVLAIAAAYELDRFAVVGRSGGGPYALACAALLPDRVTRAAVLVGLAPQGADGLDWFDGMAQFNVTEFTAAANGYEDIVAHTKAMASAAHTTCFRRPATPGGWPTGFPVPPSWSRPARPISARSMSSRTSSAGCPLGGPMIAGWWPACG